MMAYFIQQDYVQYACTCGKLKPITNVYFCRHCLKVRCGFCICHEVDSLYCANCLENMPSSEARLKKNRCGSCFDCPSCFHTLSTRATTATQSSKSHQGSGDEASKSDSKGDSKNPKKMFYLSCCNCRWTSRDIGMPDQTVATGGWPEHMSLYLQRVNSLQEYYKTQALQEKQHKLEKERKKFVMSGKYMTLTDKIGLTSAMARARVTGTPSITGTSTESATLSSPSIPISEPDDLPADIFTKEVYLKYITNMEQRLAQPEYQPVTVENLYPSAKQLFIKRSQRCRQCDHNVTKPEYNPGSIRFKIQLFAYYHIPEVRIISCSPLHPGKPSVLVLKLSNPTGHETSFSLLPISEALDKTVSDVNTDAADEVKSKFQEIDNQYAKTDTTCNAKLVTPTAQLHLPQRDDASEYVEDTQNYNDDPKVVVWRKSNKLAVRTEVTPEESLKVGDSVVAGFVLSYTYTNTVTSSPKPSTHPVQISIYLKLEMKSPRARLPSDERFYLIHKFCDHGCGKSFNLLFNNLNYMYSLGYGKDSSALCSCIDGLDNSHKPTKGNFQDFFNDWNYQQ